MNRKSVVFLILLFNFAFTFGQNQQTFKITGAKEKPVLKSLTSASNTLYQGIYNVMVLTDTLMPAQKYIINAPGTIMHGTNSKLLLEVVSSITDTVFVSIGKLQGKDTIILNRQKLPVKIIPNGWFLTLGGLTVIDTISKMQLLHYKKLGVYHVADIIKGFNARIERFDIQIGNNTFHSDSGVLTSEMIQALKYSIVGTSIVISDIVIVGDVCPTVIADHQLRLIN
jgi:hypothetical protein